MQMMLSFLAGVLLGVALTWWWLSTAYRNAVRSYHADGQYKPVRQAVARHLRVHGTLNLAQAGRMMDIGDATALQYLDQMVHEGSLARHDHRDGDAFYTLR